METKVPHLVQYQGSKRLLAPQILQYMPHKFKRLLEPFAGMAAISIAAANENRADFYLINDLNKPLVDLLHEAVENPERLLKEYSALWNEQFSFGAEHTKHFFAVRDKFNLGEESPSNMLYLLARCVKGSVRYNRDGKFNQSPDKRRHGTSPKTLAPNLMAISKLLKGRSAFSAVDFKEILAMAEPGDLVYMDPPYQGVSENKDHRYLAGVSYDEFASAVEMLDAKKIDYLISYDGQCGDKNYGKELPENLNCSKVMISSGISSQAMLLGKRSVTFEALYISNTLLPEFKVIQEPYEPLGKIV